MLKKIFVFVLIFILSGELMIKLTNYFSLFENNRNRKVAIEVDQSEELKLLNEKKIDLSDSTLRILVLGDSYIHGAGLKFDEKFSSRLRDTLKKQALKYGNVKVLDVSVPNNNNKDNVDAYFNFVERFKPQFIILGYSFNDIDGDLVGGDSSVVTSSSTNLGSKPKMLIRRITNFLYNSEVLKYTLPKFNARMLGHGILIPKSRLATTLERYDNDHQAWEVSKKLLNSMLIDSEKRGSKMIVYQYTHTNLIEYPQLLEKPAIKVETFFNQYNNVNYISGIEHFRGESAKKYFIYKYDGHPNAEASQRICSKVFQEMKPYISK